MHVLLSCVGRAAKEAVAWEVDDTRGLFRVLSKNGRSSHVRASEEGEKEEGLNGGGGRAAADVAMEEEDHRAMWVTECSYSCKKNIVVIVKKL